MKNLIIFLILTNSLFMIGGENKIELKIKFFENQKLIASPHMILIDSKKGEIEISNNERSLKFDILASELNGEIKTDIQISERVSEKFEKITHPIMLIKNKEKAEMTVSSSNGRSFEIQIEPSFL